jgi:hypothetical protein
MRQVFGDCNWIAEARIFEFSFQSGDGHPIWVERSGSLLRLDLFTKSYRSKWVIYVEFAGYDHTPEGVKRFFEPAGKLIKSMRLTRFALWNLETHQQEIFDESGRHTQRG